ncbi:hypothetical protein [Amycolatopsis panacis]|uniref:hypothetical protein n=1 Tax=Amycolatopsis panacis TaxID=2340917 RepID=UPI001314B124|nr:hypothetical protein [Amycolatopsis panacis]
MDDREKTRIEREARRDAGVRGRHGDAVRRYLKAGERHAIKENEQDLVPEPAPEPPR